MLKLRFVLQWIFQGLQAGANNVPLRMSRLKTELIDIDLVRGKSEKKYM